MNLMVNALKNAIHDLAQKMEIKGAIVSNSVNARGEIVIALVLPKRPDVPPLPPGWPPK